MSALEFIGLVASAAARSATLSAEAVAAVNRTIAARTERYRGFISALGANHGMHLARSAAETTAEAAA